jgi:hypothetical protein
MSNYLKIGNGNPIAYEEGDFMPAVTQKAERNNLLAESDRYMTVDYPTEKLEEWKVYRQALRDFEFQAAPTTEEYTWNEPVWPNKPE